MYTHIYSRHEVKVDRFKDKMFDNGLIFDIFEDIIIKRKKGCLPEKFS